MAAMAVLSSRSGKIARSLRFGLRIADFILPRIRSLSAAKPSNFYQGLAKRFAVLSRPASLNSSFSNSCRFIKARPVAAMAGLSPRSGRVARSLDLDCGWPISYCLVQAVYQRPSQAIFRKSWQSDRTASKAFKASYKASYAASYFLKLLRKLLCKRLTASSKAPCKAPYKAFYSFL